jgi:Domain of unknown function (DUF5668)/B-box zinc finger
MNCANHPDAPAVAYCRTCGKPLCNVCMRDLGGAVYCDEHVPAQTYPPPPAPGAAAVPPSATAGPPPGTPRPGIAAVLGFIPGVGAMYNGEFAKGFIHVLIFATLIWMSEHASEGLGAFVGLLIAAFYIYMPIEAYKTARAREMGLPAPDPFGFNHIFGGAPPPVRPAASAAGSTGAAEVAPNTPNSADSPSMPVVDRSCSRVPVGAVVLIGLGVIFLLNELNLLNFDWIWRFWPLILIALGVRILMQRQRRGY